VLDIARGINYLHGLKPPFIHGDIRGVSGTTYSIFPTTFIYSHYLLYPAIRKLRLFCQSNVLITEEGVAVLADYGLVFVIETTDFTSTKTAGTCRWMAPEVMNPADELLEEQDPPVLFTKESDIYAFGMTAFEVSPPLLPPSESDLGIIMPLRSFLRTSRSATRKRIALSSSTCSPAIGPTQLNTRSRRLRRCGIYWRPAGTLNLIFALLRNPLLRSWKRYDSCFFVISRRI